MAQWIRFERGGKTSFGTLEGGTIAVHDGDLLGANRATGEKVALAEVKVLPPPPPSKMICLGNNSHQLAAKNIFLVPDEPLYFLKAPNAYHPHGVPIERPKTYSGRIIYEGEL